uniref:Uncharacterized protein n=1 Tax=Anguilla anguilla TaxID=7936 RepID=A0A0E9PJI4_ANGAN
MFICLPRLGNTVEEFFLPKFQCFSLGTLLPCLLILEFSPGFYSVFLLLFFLWKAPL